MPIDIVPRYLKTFGTNIPELYKSRNIASAVNDLNKRGNIIPKNIINTIIYYKLTFVNTFE